MPGSSVVDLSNSFGAAFIGLLVSVGLHGLILGQTWMYFWHYWNRDSKALKSFIAYIVIMDTLSTAMIVYSMYWYLVLNFSNIEALVANKWFFIVQSKFGCFYNSAIQWYYARQIYLVSQNIILPIIIVSMSVVGTALGLYAMARELAGGKVASTSTKATRFNSGGETECILISLTAETIVLDILIAGLMCWALYRKKTGLARTDSMIMTLMAYTVNTGLLTALVAIALTITMITTPKSLIPLAVSFPQGKCYVNSILAMLNSRGYVRSRGDSDNSDNSFSLSSIRVVPPSEAFGSKSKPTDVSVIVHHSTTLVDAQNESDANMGRAFEFPKLDTSVISQSQRGISSLST